MRELGRVTLDESLALVALVAVKDPARHPRYAVRWLRRLLEEHDGLTREEAALATSALAALGGPATEQAMFLIALGWICLAWRVGIAILFIIDAFVGAFRDRLTHRVVPRATRRRRPLGHGRLRH